MRSRLKAARPAQDPPHVRPRSRPARAGSEAHEIVEAAERDADDVSAGDFAAAINGYRTVFDHLVATRAAANGEFDAADAEDA